MQAMHARMLVCLPASMHVCMHSCMPSRHELLRRGQVLPLRIDSRSFVVEPPCLSRGMACMHALLLACVHVCMHACHSCQACMLHRVAASLCGHGFISESQSNPRASCWACLHACQAMQACLLTRIHLCRHAWHACYDCHALLSKLFGSLRSCADMVF